MNQLVWLRPPEGPPVVSIGGHIEQHCEALTDTSSVLG